MKDAKNLSWSKIRRNKKSPYRETMNDDETLAPKLKKCRQQAGLTQLDLAEKIGMSGPAVSLIEAGHRDTRSAVILRWVRACGFEIDIRRPSDPPPPEYLDVTGLPEHDVNTLAELAAIWSRIDPIAREAFRAQILVFKTFVPEENSRSAANGE